MQNTTWSPLENQQGPCFCSTLILCWVTKGQIGIIWRQQTRTLRSPHTINMHMPGWRLGRLGITWYTIYQDQQTFLIATLSLNLQWESFQFTEVGMRKLKAHKIYNLWQWILNLVDVMIPVLEETFPTTIPARKIQELSCSCQTAWLQNIIF